MTRAAAFTTTNSRGGKSHRAGTPPNASNKQSSEPRQAFVAAALNMSWQLAVVVLVPILLGAQLDKALGTKYLGVVLGLLVALAGSGLVVWRALQAANRLPVPRLTEKQKRAIRKAYEDEDKEND